MQKLAYLLDGGFEDVVVVVVGLDGGSLEVAATVAVGWFGSVG